MDRYRDLIKEKDLEQIPVVKMLGWKYLLSYDRDFDAFEEYKSPKEFITALNLEAAEEAGSCFIRKENQRNRMQGKSTPIVQTHLRHTSSDQSMIDSRQRGLRPGS